MTADAALVRRCLTGDPAACRELVERFQADVFAVCHRLLAHAHDAEDVTQEVFPARLPQSQAVGFRPTSRPWMLGIAINRCRTWMGRRTRRRNWRTTCTRPRTIARGRLGRIATGNPCRR